MSIKEEFPGLEMQGLIAGPIIAAKKAQMEVANSTAECIETVGMDDRQQTKRMSEKNNNSFLDVPPIAIVPVPDLDVDNVSIEFDKEVAQSEKEKSDKNC